MHHDEITTAAKITPAATGAILSNITLSDWVSIATLFYIALQVGLLVPKYWAMMPKCRAKVSACRQRLVAFVRGILAR